MNAPRRLLRSLTDYGWRLLIVAMLAVAVTGMTYAVSVSPVGTSMASTGRRPPGRPAAQPPSAPGGGAGIAEPSMGTATGAQPASPSAPPVGSRPPGRGGSLTRGLPELGMHAGVIAVLIVVVNGLRYLWQTIQRRRGGNRAPIYRHAAAGR